MIERRRPHRSVRDDMRTFSTMQRSFSRRVSTLGQQVSTFGRSFSTMGRSQRPKSDYVDSGYPKIDEDAATERQIIDILESTPVPAEAELDIHDDTRDDQKIHEEHELEPLKSKDS